MTDDPFVTHRGLLFTVAYEMLGSAVDAEDVVQETWLRWADVDQAEVRDPRAYLVRIVTRQALNRLRTVSRRREDYVGEWLPEPLLTSPDVAEDAELAENVSIAMLTVLETLGPAERAVFVLHEVFETPYDEIAEVVGKTPAAVRQIAHRAREHVAARRPRMQVDRAQQEAILEKFMAAIYLWRPAGTGGGPRPGCGVDRRWRRPGGRLLGSRMTGVEKVAAFLARVVELSGPGGDHCLAQRHAGCPVRRRWRRHRGQSGGRGRPDHPDLCHSQPTKAGMAGKGGGTAAVTSGRRRTGDLAVLNVGSRVTWNAGSLAVIDHGHTARPGHLRPRWCTRSATTALSCSRAMSPTRRSVNQTARQIHITVRKLDMPGSRP